MDKSAYDFNLWNQRQFAEKLGYIHRNPVKRGLCERPESGAVFRHPAIGIEGRVEIESEWSARKRERATERPCPPVELPHSSQNQGLSGPPARRAPLRKLLNLLHQTEEPFRVSLITDRFDNWLDH